MSSHFEAQHAHIEALLTAHLLEVVGGDFAQAQRLFAQWHGALQTHIHLENTALLPHVPSGARWAATVYLREHERIALLAEEYAQRLQQVLHHPPRDAWAQRRASLYLLDAIHALRHVLEHHHERENTALAHELPPELQQQVWAQMPLDA